jgi:leader peptidase (prepilin peptidase)/N-methyltransferase
MASEPSSLPFWYWIAVAICLGAVVGSFLNVVMYRVPRGESLWWPGSQCPACGAPIRAWNNVPVLAWLWLRGRCRDCRAAISARYPLVEALTALLFALAIWRFGPTPSAAIAMAFSAALIAAGGIDFDHHIIPDAISLGGLGLGLSAVPALRVVEGVPPQAAWIYSIAGALLGGGLLWTVGFVHARVCAARGRRFAHWPEAGERYPRPADADYWYWFPGMGFGDVKLLAMIGTVLGPLGVVHCLIAASAIGLLLGLVWFTVRRDASAPFGFGPALAAGALVVLLYPASLLPLP